MWWLCLWQCWSGSGCSLCVWLWLNEIPKSKHQVHLSHWSDHISHQWTKIIYSSSFISILILCFCCVSYWFFLWQVHPSNPSAKEQSSHCSDVCKSWWDEELEFKKQTRTKGNQFNFTKKWQQQSIISLSNSQTTRKNKLQKEDAFDSCSILFLSCSHLVTW